MLVEFVFKLAYCDTLHHVELDIIALRNDAISK